jgi:hypothetical protein
VHLTRRLIIFSADSSRTLGTYRGLFSCPIKGKLFDDLRSALNKGLDLGSEYFRDQVEMLYSQRVKPAKVRRPKRLSCT